MSAVRDDTTEWVCDRCASSIRADGRDRPEGWSVYVGPPATRSYDLCPECTTELDVLTTAARERVVAWISYPTRRVPWV